MTDLYGRNENYFPAKEVKTPDFYSFVSFDLETTGLNKDEEIIEIGAVKVVNGEFKETFQELIKPDASISPFVVTLTGITDEMVEGCERIDAVLPKFQEFCGNNILLGHNAISFDCRLIRKFAQKCDIYFGNDVFDTLRYSRYRCEPFPGMKNHKLSYMCQYFGINPKEYHRALADSIAAAELYFKLKKYGKPGKK